MSEHTASPDADTPTDDSSSEKAIRHDEAPSVCVIIPTMQRRAFLDETLSQLVRTDYPHDKLEIFIADGGSTDGSAEVVKRFQQDSDISIRWHSDPSLRVSAARNYAIERTEAEILVFLDDDCRSEPGWIGRLVKPIIEGRANLTGGADRAPADDPLLARCEDVAFRSVIGSGGVRGSSGPSITGFCPMTCNMAITRRKMLEIGCFDLTMREVEDTDFVYKARKCGTMDSFVPDATLEHRRRASLRSIFIHNYVRGAGRSFLCKRYPDQPQRVFFIPTLGLLLGLILAIAGFFFPWAWGALMLGAALYLLLLMLIGIEGVRQVKDLRALFIVPFLTALHHFAYSVGTLLGPLTRYRRILVNPEDFRPRNETTAAR